MSKIKMTPELLRQSSKKIQGYQNEIQSIIRKIDAEVMSADKGWTGLSQQSFSGNYRNVRPFMNEYSKMIADTCKMLKTAADTMEAADKNLGNMINKTLNSDKNSSKTGLDILSSDLYKGSYYTNFDILTKTHELEDIIKQYKYFKDGSFLGVFEKELAKDAKRYAYIFNPNNPAFREDVLEGLGRFGEKYDLEKIATFLKEGRSLTAEQALLAEKFIPSAAAKSALFKEGPLAAVFSGGIELYKDLNDPNKKSASQIAADVTVEAGVGIGSAAACAAVGAAVGSIVPGAGNVIGAGVGFMAGLLIDAATGAKIINGKSVKDWGKAELGKAFGAIGDSINSVSDKLKDVGNALWGNSLGCIFGG